MSIFEIGISQALGSMQKAAGEMDGLTQQMNTGRKINAAKDDPVAWAKSQKSLLQNGNLLALNDTLTTVATNIKVVDKTMGVIGKHLQEMKSQLEIITKTYPPYPPGDPERVKMLRNYMGLRQLIDQLTIPPDEGARKIMADPATTPGAGDWEVVVDESGSRVVMRSREVHTGPTGLDVPALADTATDADVYTAIAGVDAAQKTLDQRHAGLVGDATGIVRSQDFNGKMALMHKTAAEKLVTADMDEAAAEYKSVELKNQLALEAARGLTRMRSAFLEMAG